MFDLFLAYNTPLHYACRYGQIEIVKRLVIDLKENVNANNRVFFFFYLSWSFFSFVYSSPLHYAVEAGNNEIIDILLQHKADLQHKDSVLFIL